MSYTFQSGWNLLGSFGSSDLINTVFDNNIFSEIAVIFKYSPGAGYTLIQKSTDSLEQEFGYWFFISNTVTGSITRGSFSNTVNVTYPTGWNLVSHPLNSSELISTSFGDKLDNISVVFKYVPGSGYTLISHNSANWDPGYGYWFFFNTETTITYTGETPPEPEPEPESQPEPQPEPEPEAIPPIPTFGLRLGDPIGNDYPIQVVSPAGTRITGVLVAFNENITFNTSNTGPNAIGENSTWLRQHGVSGQKTIAAASTQPNGIENTDANWLTIGWVTSEETLTLDTSSTIKTTGYPACTLDVATDLNSITTYDITTNTDFFG